MPDSHINVRRVSNVKLTARGFIQEYSQPRAKTQFNGESEGLWLGDCIRCRPQEGPVISDLRGNVGPDDLATDNLAAEAELTEPRTGTVVYHYFPADNKDGLPLWKIIYIDKAVGSRVRCMTETEILQSVRNASAQHKPHYGDGAYCTLHRDFSRACTAVQHAHGLDPNRCQYRAVLVIDQPERFRKFQSTGGVMRSIPREEYLTKGQLVKIGDATGEARLLWIEAFTDGAWRRVPQPEG